MDRYQRSNFIIISQFARNDVSWSYIFFDPCRLLQLHPNLATADKIQIWVLINGKIDMMIVMLKDMVWYHITVIIWIADEDDADSWKREAKKRSGAGSKWAASLEETPHLTLIPSLTYQWNEKISVLIYSQYLSLVKVRRGSKDFKS